ncbi:MAG: SDR family NAD(P)-dependent oxidoreductase [Proteobacteria bacterium]|nr:SDR family NAD(P)-dependent oxidoreductase [Pseudomonadota bacterium]
MSLLTRLSPAGANGFGAHSTAEEVSAGLDLSGKTYLVTGVNSGLGAETLRVLTLRGAHVIGAARSLKKAEAATSAYGELATPVACELSEPDSVRATVQAVKDTRRPLDAIITNAGIMALPERTVKHGLELQFLTNHIGHFILVTGLLDSLSETGRVVSLSSSAHTNPYREGIRFDDLDAAKGYSGWGAYGQSKLANLLFARELATRLPAGQTANAVHPGVIATNLGRNMNIPGFLDAALRPVLNATFFKSVPQGAATQTYAASHPDAAEINGEYFADCNVARSSKYGRDADLARRLWETSEALVAKL